MNLFFFTLFFKKGEVEVLMQDLGIIWEVIFA